MQHFLKGGAFVAAGILIASPTFAATLKHQADNSAVASNQNTTVNPNLNNKSDAMMTAQRLLNESKSIVSKMKADPKLAKDMAMAKGILIFPDFGRGAFIIGGRGGTGLLLDKAKGQWSDPVFFDMGGGSIGPQIGASGGQIAFLLMTDKAVKNFESGNNFSINAGAGFTIVNYSANTQTSSGKGADVIMWSNTSGAYVGATASLTDVNLDKSLNTAFYGMNVDPHKVMMGQVAVNKPNANALKQELPG